MKLNLMYELTFVFGSLSSTNRYPCPEICASASRIVSEQIYSQTRNFNTFYFASQVLTNHFRFFALVRSPKTVSPHVLELSLATTCRS